MRNLADFKSRFEAGCVFRNDSMSLYSKSLLYSTELKEYFLETISYYIFHVAWNAYHFQSVWNTHHFHVAWNVYHFRSVKNVYRS